LQEELDEEERQRMARVHEAAQSFTEEQWENIRARVEADEELTRRLQAEEMNKYSEVNQAKMLVDIINQRKRYFAAQKAKAKRNKPMTQAQQRTYMDDLVKLWSLFQERFNSTEPKEDKKERSRARVEADEELTQRLQAEEMNKYSEVNQAKMLVDIINQRKRYFAAQKAKAKRNKPMTQAQQRTYIAVLEFAAESTKRRAEEELDQRSSKRQKTGESSKLAEAPRDKDANELLQEELQQMMIIDGVDIYMLVEREYPLSRGVLTQLLVKEMFNSTEPIDVKEREIWVELKRLVKPDTDDELWKLQKHIHDLTWRLYGSCGVHHVSTEKGIDIYMLVEKKYPLSRETLRLMLVTKLLVDEKNKMSRELLRKIFMQAKRQRR
nr:hypothetical protein [Tanacetum cinerariifolium]